jgi:hypothetical protein
VRGYDSLIVIAYHASGYPFNCADGSARWTYYGISGTPIVQIDGSTQEVGGVSMPGTMYPIYRRWLTNRSAVSSPLVIRMSCAYDSVANTGSVTAVVTNTSSATVSGNVRFAVTENKILYSWYGLTTVEHVCRDMLPDAAGEAVTIAAGDSATKTQSFTVTTGWNENNIYIACFVQGSSREIYQAGQIGIMAKPDMDYYGADIVELSGNSDRIAQPGEDVRLYVAGKNNGGGVYPGGATVSITDPYLSITASNPQTVAVGAGDMDTVLALDVSIASNCPTPYTGLFLLNFGTPGDTSTFRFMVVNRAGFADDMESGVNGWTTSGSYNNWHQTTYKSHSATHSWYSGVESNHQYTALNDASLITPYFVVTPDSSLTFWHQYATEVDYDYMYCEVDNNLGWWQILGIYNGSQAAWTQVTRSLAAFSGQTVRLRFRFLSDQSVNGEGWYVDDVNVPLFGIEENTGQAKTAALRISPNPFRTNATMSLGFATDLGGVKGMELKIYDATGRMIKDLSLPTACFLPPTVVWDGTDMRGKAVPAGVYFVKLGTGPTAVTEKVLRLR